MSLLKSITGLLIAVTLFVACSENDNNKKNKSEGEDQGEIKEVKLPSEKLNGSWEIMRAEGIAVKSNLGTVYTFEGDNLTMGKNGLNNPGKTEITDSTFSFQGNGNEYKFLFHYHFDGDTLVTSMENSNGQHFYMLKK